ncbi:unnamed protein product [Schistosoma mattheei]|uniref:Uncharacterized protein n=1 Tax=Schistosoma mattheei TaxID=31246 RepID=A0A3P8BCC4_9TREM|nr:unnamed protein product [Schistosoma mattheei]
MRSRSQVTKTTHNRVYFSGTSIKTLPWYGQPGNNNRTHTPNRTPDHYETWILGIEDTRKLLVFDHRCLRNFALICWDYQVSNSEVRHRILGNDGKSVDEVVNLHRLRWLGHVLRMTEHRLLRSAMLTSVGDGWKKVNGGQTKTWQQCLKLLTSGLSHVTRCRLIGWDPRDYRN